MLMMLCHVFLRISFLTHSVPASGLHQHGNHVSVSTHEAENEHSDQIHFTSKSKYDRFYCQIMTQVFGYPPPPTQT